MKTTTTLPTGAPPVSSEPFSGRPAAAPDLIDPDLLARRRGVAEELSGSVQRGEITAEQARKFLLRIESGLCREQARRRPDIVGPGCTIRTSGRSARPS